MNKINKAILMGLSFLLGSSMAFAADPIVSIPLNTFINPTFDLMDQSGNKLSSSDLDLKFRQGVDLSKFNPIENKYWQNKKFPAKDAKLSAEMPDATNAVVTYNQSLGAYREAQLYSIYVAPTSDSNIHYGLTFGLQIHASLIKAALLRKLGIYQEAPKHYLKIKVKFASAEEMNTFVTTAFNVDGSKEDNPDYLSLEPFQRGILSDVNKEEKSLIIHDAYLEKLNPEVPSLFDGLTPATGNNINLFAQSRAFRSLIIPFVIADLKESLNGISPQAATPRGGSVDLNFINNIYFKDKTSEADAKWILRRVGQLTDADWNEIVDAGGYPAQLRELVKMKIMYRSKNLVNNFFKADQRAQVMPVQMPPLDINSADGCVVHSKIMPICTNIPGYPQRWSYGDRQSPFEASDFIRYIGIKTQASTLAVALGKLSEHLQKKQSSQTLTGLELSPQGIRPIGSVSEVLKAVSYTADRIITTGTYFGSQAPIQLVDSVTITGAVAYQNTLFEAGGIMKNYGANVGYNRSFTYVTPIKTVKEATNAPWANLFYKSKLNRLMKPLDTGKGLTAFLSNMAVGEVFTISDSFGVMGRAGVTAIIDDLIGFSALGTPSVGLSIDASKNVLLRQTQFIRTDEGIQVFVRDGNSLMWGVEFNVNYFINLLKIRAQTSKSDLHTEAYLIDYQTALMKQVDSGEIKDVSDDLQTTIDAQNALSEKGAQSILALIRQSNVWPMRENFKYRRYEITHGLKTSEIQSKLLFYRSTKMDEEHILTVYKPEMVAPEGSTVVNKALQFSLYQKGELHGSDKFGFGLDVLDATLAKTVGKNAPQFSQASQNPSQMPFGKAYWRIVRSDADLNADRSVALKSVATVDHVWSGWSIKQADLQLIMQELCDSLKNIRVGNVSIPDGALQHTKKIDFYRITSHLTLLPEAIDKIKELILAPNLSISTDKVKYANWLMKWVADLTAKKSEGDKVIFNNLMKVLGNGDEKVGLQNYVFECQSTRSKAVENSQVETGAWARGTYFECLEPWVDKLIKLSRTFPKDNIRAQNRWMADVLYVLDEKIPQGYLLNELGIDKFIYYVDFAGFRVGDEDGDDGIYTPFVLGEPTKRSDYGNGLISLLSGKFKIVPTELMTTRASIQ